MLAKNYKVFQISILFVFIGSITYSQTITEKAGKDRPNIIFMMVDDMGKEWTGCYGGEGNHTPNIDKLAASGMTFDNAYSMPQCVPTRMCLMTGQYPANNGWVDHRDPPIHPLAYLDGDRNPSLGKIMRNSGYRTGVVGKWTFTNTRNMPQSVYRLGFDEFMVWGVLNENGRMKSRYWDPYLFYGKGKEPGRTETFKGAFGPDKLFDAATEFITRDKQKPFFLYYSFNLVHGPNTSTPLEPDIASKDAYPAMVRYMDHIVGKMVSFLEKEGVRKNTIIIWTTDNGSANNLQNRLNGRLVNGGKKMVTENGIDAPFIVNCPGLVPKTRTLGLLDFTDILPTCVDFAGVKLPEQYNFDGVSQAKFLTGKTRKSPKKWMLSMGGQMFLTVNSEGHVVNRFYYRNRVIKNGRYKLYVGIDRQPIYLYDLEKDPAEENDLIDNPKYQIIVQDLHQTVVENFSKVDNEPDYKEYPVTEPELYANNKWDKPNCIKQEQQNPNDPNRPLQVQMTLGKERKIISTKTILASDKNRLELIKSPAGWTEQPQILNSE